MSPKILQIILLLFESPWDGVTRNEIRVNVDSVFVDAFDTYHQLQSRFPENSIGYRHFRTTKNFTENGNLETDVFRTPNKTGPKVIIFSPLLKRKYKNVLRMMM